MALSDCPHCWDTPCTCGYMYWFMSMDRLEQVYRAVKRARGKRRGGRRPPGSVQEELELRDLVSVGYSIQKEAPPYRVGEDGRMGYSRHDVGSTTARLDLTFDEVSYAERVK